jgi:hypothetical protein
MNFSKNFRIFLLYEKIIFSYNYFINNFKDKKKIIIKIYIN